MASDYARAKIEKAARAVCQRHTGDDRDWESWKPNVEEILAFLAAIETPSEDMLSAGDSMMPQIAAGEDITTGYDALKDAWPAMLAALRHEIEAPETAKSATTPEG